MTVPGGCFRTVVRNENFPFLNRDLLELLLAKDNLYYFAMKFPSGFSTKSDRLSMTAMSMRNGSPKYRRGIDFGDCENSIQVLGPSRA